MNTSRLMQSIKESIDALPVTMSEGHRALETLSIYLSARLPVPVEVLKAIDHCYRHFTEGKPVAFRPSIERDIPAPLTLGDAFGVPDHKGHKGRQKVALKRKRVALAQPKLITLFTGQGESKKLPKTKEGWPAAAEKLGLTPSEVEDWVTKHLTVRRKPRKK